MELADIVSRIREELDDPSVGQFFTDKDIYDSIEDAMTLLAIFTGYLNKSYELNIEAGRVYYDLSPISDFLRVVAIYNPNNKLFLKPTNILLLNKSINRWELTAGTPQLYCLFPTNLIAFYPHYQAVPEKPLTIYYKAYPKDFIGVINSIQLPKIAEDVLIYYVISDLYDQLLEMEKSKQAWELFLNYYNTFKQIVERVNRVDYVGVMNVDKPAFY
jgi:hypothetical protein